jgi:hypothetical protein
VPPISTELELIIQAWTELPEAIRKKIVEIIQQSMKNMPEKS